MKDLVTPIDSSVCCVGDISSYMSRGRYILPQVLWEEYPQRLWGRSILSQVVWEVYPLAGRVGRIFSLRSYGRYTFSQLYSLAPSYCLIVPDRHQLRPHQWLGSWWLVFCPPGCLHTLLLLLLFLDISQNLFLCGTSVSLSHILSLLWCCFITSLVTFLVCDAVHIVSPFLRFFFTSSVSIFPFNASSLMIFCFCLSKVLLHHFCGVLAPLWCYCIFPGVSSLLCSITHDSSGVLIPLWWYSSPFWCPFFSLMFPPLTSQVSSVCVGPVPPRLLSTVLTHNQHDSSHSPVCATRFIIIFSSPPLYPVLFLHLFSPPYTARYSIIPLHTRCFSIMSLTVIFNSSPFYMASFVLVSLLALVSSFTVYLIPFSFLFLIPISLVNTIHTYVMPFLVETRNFSS